MCLPPPPKKKKETNYCSALKDRWQRAGPAPHQIRPVKGAVHITVNRQFVEYAINDPVAKDFLKWNQKVSVPDETFFASLNYNPHLRVPGSYKGMRLEQ